MKFSSEIPESEAIYLNDNEILFYCYGGLLTRDIFELENLDGALKYILPHIRLKFYS